MSTPIPPCSRDADGTRAVRTTARARGWSTLGAVSALVATAVGAWLGRDISVWVVGSSSFWLGLMIWAVGGVVSGFVAWIGWRHWAPVAITLALAGSWAFVALDDSAARRDLTHHPQGWFEAHRADFDKAVRWGETGCCTNTYRSDLPDALQYLTVDGQVVGNPRELFFPQWQGIFGNAGGYWYSPDRPPSDSDEFSPSCLEPTDLGDGWWMCRM